jgi:hypothetical protein
MLRSCPLQKAASAAFAAKRPQRRATVCQAQPNPTKPNVEQDPANVGGLGKLQVGSLVYLVYFVSPLVIPCE